MGFTSKVKRWVSAERLIKQGYSSAKVAGELGLSERWVRKLKRDPRIYAAEKPTSRYSGRPCVMSKEAQNNARLALIGQFSLTEHSVKRAQRIIAEVTGIEYCLRHVYDLIKRLKIELPKGALFGHYNHKKRRCLGCGAKLVKRTCLLCLLKEIEAAKR